MTCKLNERSALNTKLTKDVVEQQNIVVLKADMTDDAPDIESKLVEFGNTAKAIPYYAVFRPGEEPHHFDGNFVTVGAKGFLDRAGITPFKEGELRSTAFSKPKLDRLLANGKSVLVHFHADWDVISKFNETKALNTEHVISTLEERGIVSLKADMTDKFPEAEQELKAIGNTAMAVPFYALYRPGEEPHVFGGNFTMAGSRGFLESAGLLPKRSQAVTNVSDSNDADEQVTNALLPSAR